MKELVIKKCLKCGAIVLPLIDCNCKECGIKCCGEEMKILKANSEDASKEKHIPTYKIENDKIIVKVNHPMEEEHYINYIILHTEEKDYIEKLNYNMKAEVEFKYIKNSELYSYCNKHGLWKSEIIK